MRSSKLIRDFTVQDGELCGCVCNILKDVYRCFVTKRDFPRGCSAGVGIQNYKLAGNVRSESRGAVFVFAKICILGHEVKF